jgi:hypothetical protein
MADTNEEFAGWSISDVVARIGLDALVQSLRKGTIVSINVISNRDATALGAKEWAERDEAACRKVLRQEGSQKPASPLRFFPFLRSPQAERRLDGLELRAVALMYVLQDPEVATLSKDALEEWPDVFSEGRYPSGYVTHEWPIQLTADQLAYSFAWPAPLKRVERPPPSNEELTASQVIVDRWHALIRLLFEGRIAAYGTWSGSGALVQIDRLQWRRSSLALDLLHGDLIDTNGGKSAPRWTGISLKSREPLFHVQPLVDHRPRQPTFASSQSNRKSAAHASIEQAVLALWPGGPPVGLLIKQRDAKIIEWIKGRGLTAPSARTINRFFDRIGGTCP